MGSRSQPPLDGGSDGSCLGGDLVARDRVLGHDGCALGVYCLDITDFLVRVVPTLLLGSVFHHIVRFERMGDIAQIEG